MIDWTNLIQLRGAQDKAFEELIFQVAHRLYMDEGHLIRVDDTGGGDGVECYISLANGDQWGWQAKFYPGGRLNQGNRKASIAGSLQRSCEVHPNLKKWFLCIPTNLTPAEQQWFDEVLPQSIPIHRNVDLEYWGDSQFIEFFAQSAMVGIKAFFFGELELSMEWFNEQVQRNIKRHSDKVKTSLHVSTEVDREIHCLLRDSDFAETITNDLVEAQEYVDNLNRKARSLSNRLVNITDIEWKHEPKQIEQYATSLAESLATLGSELRNIIEHLGKGINQASEPVPLPTSFGSARIALDAYADIRDQNDPHALPFQGEEQHRNHVVWEAYDVLSIPLHEAEHLIGLFDNIYQWIMRSQQTVLHLLGNAGAGKSDIAVFICSSRIQQSLPALFVNGADFTMPEPIHTQLLKILDVPRHATWSTFLGALSAAATAYMTKIPIVIDGLNEAVLDGKLSHLWRRELANIEHDISDGRNLAAITTCRSSYVDAIWDSHPENSFEVTGFETANVQQATKLYFDHYKILGDTTLLSLSQFEHPLYLKLFCETLNPTKQQDREVYVGQHAIFAVFDSFLDACNQRVSRRLNLHPSGRIVSHALSKLALAIWDASERVLSIEQAFEIVDGRPLHKIDLKTSVTNALLEESLLVDRDFYGEREVIGFTYDLLGGYVIATALAAEHSTDLAAFLNRSTTVERLFGPHPAAYHPIGVDIARCIAALIPRTTGGNYLHELVDTPGAAQLSIEALFEIDPHLITERAVDLIQDLFMNGSNRRRLLGLSMASIAHSNHPLNAAFWSKQLKRLDLAGRDLSWSEHLQWNRFRYLKLVEEFSATCTNESLSSEVEERIHLLVEVIRWCLTSTVRSLRDQATSALVHYGLRWPDQLLSLLDDSMSVNDPYVPERVLAAMYGVAMILHQDDSRKDFVDDVLLAVAHLVFKFMFDENAPYSTTHILARDYARHTIEIALIRHPRLFTDEQKHRIEESFKEGGKRVWARSPDRNAGQYRLGNRPINTLNHDPLVKLGFKQSVHDHRADVKQGEELLWWRIYELGYKYDLFHDIDIELASLDSRLGGDRYVKKVDTYGQKYCRIATFELAGVRDDLRLMDHRDGVLSYRSSFVDIDPSFPAPSYDSQLIENSSILTPWPSSLGEWVEDGGVPDIVQFLVVDDLADTVGGPWVLLDGWINAEDESDHRALDFQLRSLVFQAKDIPFVMKHLGDQDFSHPFWLPDVPSDSGRFGGEVPWCDTYPSNGWVTLDLVVGSRTVEKTEQELVVLMGETVVPLDEYPDWHQLIAQEEGCVPTNQPDGADLPARLDTRSRQVVQRVPIEDSVRALIPVRETLWEDHHSTSNPSRVHTVLARELCEHLRIGSQSPRFDLCINQDELASIHIRYGSPYCEHHFLTYIRQELLDRYLVENNYALVWLCWGERRPDSATFSAFKAEEATGLDEPYRGFHEIRQYTH